MTCLQFIGPSTPLLTVENDAINFKILLLTENVVITKFIVKEYIFGKIFKIHNSYSL